MTLPLLLCHAGVHAAEMNDTGIGPNQWGRADFGLGTNNYNPLNYFQVNAPRQDAQFGRDPAHTVGALLKVGGGDLGFDFTRICGNGDEEGTGSCPSGLTVNDIGSGAAQWACTRDNVTGRTWELKTDDGGLRDQDWTYSWYSTDASSNGGSVGAQAPASNPSVCGSHMAFCNTEAYAAALNALNAGAGLCGFTDWRLPQLLEMAFVTHYGEIQTVSAGEYARLIDLNYFPHIKASAGFMTYWSATASAEDTNRAWRFLFNYEKTFPGTKSSNVFVMLVRSDD
ncbi:MAG: DUF1566 domain-containing protein [Lysobacterales bacterium]